MRPNLSLEKIAGALAVLGTTALMTACGGDAKPPTNPSDMAPAGEKAAGDAKPADPTAGAADMKPAETAAKPAETMAKPVETAAKPADAKPADAKGATPAPTSTAGKKPAAPTKK